MCFSIFPVCEQILVNKILMENLHREIRRFYIKTHASMKKIKKEYLAVKLFLPLIQRRTKE